MTPTTAAARKTSSYLPVPGCEQGDVDVGRVTAPPGAAISAGRAAPSRGVSCARVEDAPPPPGLIVRARRGRATGFVVRAHRMRRSRAAPASDGCHAAARAPSPRQAGHLVCSRHRRLLRRTVRDASQIGCLRCGGVVACWVPCPWIMDLDIYTEAVFSCPKKDKKCIVARFDFIW
jgi:hypothetical protein